MGLQAVEKVIATLQRRIEQQGGRARLGASDLTALERAIGKRLGGKEQARCQDLLERSHRHFDRDALRLLEALAGAPAPGRRPVRFARRAALKTGVVEQSALTFLGERHGFVTVDDESGTIWRVPKPTAGQRTLAAEALGEADELTGLEAVTFDAARSVLLVASASTRAVYELPLRLDGARVEVGEPRRLGKLPAIGSEANSGWEGMTVVSGRLFADGQDRLAVIHERAPRGVGLFRRDTLAADGFVLLPRAMEAALPDLSDIAFDARTGHLFLLSDEGQTVFEAELVVRERRLGGSKPVVVRALIPIGATPLPETSGKRRLQPEGLAFDERGDLWIACEHGSQLIPLRRVER